jgi:hypothetical protein
MLPTTTSPIHLPLKNAPDDVNSEVEKIVADVKDGKITVIEDTTSIE